MRSIYKLIVKVIADENTRFKLRFIALIADYMIAGTHHITYLKTTCAMRADAIRCVVVITSIAGAYGIQRLCITFIIIVVIHTINRLHPVG
jgi:hypothetical protein